MASYQQQALICCPLCEESVQICTCRFNVDEETDKSQTIFLESEIRICGVCGTGTRQCLCDFPTHTIDTNTGTCIKGFATNLHNQQCPVMRSDTAFDASTPKMKHSGLRVRRKLFEEIPPHYVSVSQGLCFPKPEYEIHQVKSSEEIFLRPSETGIIRSNIIVTEPIGKIVGFLAVSGNHYSYWLAPMSNECFWIKTGVIQSDFVGPLHVSVVNKSRYPILEFSKFI